MDINESPTNSLIIIAEDSEQVATDIQKRLNDSKFSSVQIVQSVAEIYQTLRLFYNAKEQLGLIIINEALAGTQLSDMCAAFSSLDEGVLIPFIVLSNDEIYSIQQLKEQNPRALIHSLPIPVNYPELLSVVKLQLGMKEERLLRHEQKQRLINELSERKLLDAKLKYLVVHDELTGVFNRSNFEKKLKSIFEKGKKYQHDSALLFIDMDRFSIINEIEGFDAGDSLLVEIVNTIRTLLDKNDLFARIGSDEFGLFIENKPLEEVRALADAIKNKLEALDFVLEKASYSTSASIGIFLLSDADESWHPSNMIAKAKQACNMAKEHGRNLVWIYNKKDTKVQERNNDLHWVPIIKHALIENRFFLVFQPVVDLLDGSVSHYEALLRMRGEDKQIIYPGDFIPVAERMGLIHGIDRWVVVHAINTLAGLQDKAGVSFAINLSSVAFQDDSLLPLLKQQLEKTQLAAERITFEITETAAIENFEQTRQLIEDIRALGCKFALDDFGAGFCSFNYLKSFPVDYVKIDGQFIQNLLTDDIDQVLVKSMAEIGKNLGKKTIAEFVETPGVVVKLKELGVDLGQGYLFGKPEVNLLADDAVSLSQLIEPSD